MANDTIKRRPSRIAAAVLLESAALPGADLTDAHMEHFFYCGTESHPFGLVGIELCDHAALLRSLVVAEGHRATGLGAALLGQAEQHARDAGAHSIYLLTTTAERFFSRHGYTSAPRDSAPEAIRNTREFADICPASAVFMVKHLG